MKNILFALLLFSTYASAQQFTLIGKVTNQKGEPSKAATVLLYKQADSVLLKASLTNNAGSFRITGTAAQGCYLIVRSVGFQSYRSEQIILTENIILKPIVLISNSRELAAIEIKAQRPLIEVMPDKTVFNVHNTLNATGLSAFDVLRKAPGVVIDNQNSLIVEGKTGVGIYIDGKLSQLSGQDLTNYLKTLQSSDIEAIEIITQPSAKYDAAGTAGIINLRLKKDKNYGTNGSLSSGYAVGTYSKYNSSVSVNNRSAKANFYLTYSNNIGTNLGYINLDRFQSGFEYDQHSSNVSKDQAHNIRAGMDYALNTNNTVGVLVSGNFSGYNSDNTSRTPIINSQTDITQQVLKAYGFTTNKNDNLTTNVNYRFADKKGHEFSIDGDFGYYNSDRDNLQPNYYYDAGESTITSQSVFRMVTPVNIRLFSVKADYSQLIGKTKFSAGMKASSVKTANVFNFYDVGGLTEVYNTTRSNTFNYMENINAAYVNLSRSWKKLSMQAGLRAEQTISDGELTSVTQSQDGSVKRNYLNLFPSAGLTYQVGTKNSLALTYSRRIQRPDYRSLNPFEYNIDELSFSKGNPFLKPQYTDAVKVSHTYNSSLTTSFTYSYISGFFAQITDTLASNKNFISPQNIANQQVLNVGVSYPFSAAKWWSVYTSINAYRSIYAATNAKFISINQNTLSLYGQNSFSLPKGYRFEVSGWFSSPSIWAGTYRTRSLGSLDLALQKSLVKSKLSIRAAVSDVLHTSNWTGTTQYGQLFIKGSGGYESRQFRVNLNYSFGRNEIKSAVKRNSAVEEEKGRIGNR